MKRSMYKNFEELPLFLNAEIVAKTFVGGFMEDLFGKELKPWQENEKTETEP